MSKRCLPVWCQTIQILLCLAIGPVWMQGQDLVLSEFMAANGGALRDIDGDTSDWIELYNPAPVDVSLEGWALTDDIRNLGKWRFPKTTIPARGFRIVFASGKNRVDPRQELHTGFSLSADGESLALVTPDGRTVVSAFGPEYPKQVADVSFGVAMTLSSIVMTPDGPSVRFRAVPSSGWSADWNQVGFEDSDWRLVSMGAGYLRAEASSTEPAEPPPLLTDMTRPGDFLVPTSQNSPANEGVENAIDNSTSTKYLNFDKLNAGFTVTPSVGPSVVTGLRLTSANDAPERDPTSYVLLGSNDGTRFVEVARGTVPSFSARFTTVVVAFPNATAWRHYRLLFPTVRSAGSAVAMQLAEVEFLGVGGALPMEFGTLIRSDVGDDLFGKSAGAQMRIPFVLASVPSDGRLLLRLRYDDGFVAYLNGHEVARGNAPSPLTASSVSLTNRLRRAAATEVPIDLTDRRSLLREGANVLAVHGLNSSADSRDFLLDARLEWVRVTLGESGYLTQATPGAENLGGVGGLVDDVRVSPSRGFYDAPISVTLSCPTPDVVIRYTTNGSPPSATNGVIYSAPITIQRTTPIRVGAFRDGWRSSGVTTHSYIFLDDVIQQTRVSVVQSGFPASWGGVTADYGLDPRVAGPAGTDLFGGKYRRSLKADLVSLPTMSIVMSMSDMFGAQGIYPNAENRGGGWERPMSIEWLMPDNSGGFQENAGIRIQGGAFRRFDLSLKKSFRVVFRERYGVSELRYPLFGSEATDRFDNLVLRANSNDAWPYGGDRAVYVRDAFAMETARAMGIPSSHTRFAHLYINGVYWGLYNPVERPDAAFAAAYIGGDKDTWDSINQDSAPDGNYEAWNRLLGQLNQNMSSSTAYQRIQGNHPDGTRNPAFEDLLNVGNLIDYLILNFYVGNTDWPGRNWWAGRDRNNGDGFTFRPWDTETALGFGPTDVNVTGASDAVARPYAALRANADFRLEFADHVYRHFFHGGPLAVNAASPRWDPIRPTNNYPAARFVALAESIRSGVVGESARWGDQLRATPWTRDEHWQKERDRLLADYFPRRSGIVLAQFRQAGLFPRTDPPVMNQRGGSVPAGFELKMTAVAGTIYYTTNGLDPRRATDRLAYTGPVTLTDLTLVRARVLNGSEWSALNEATFVVGTPRLGISELMYHPAPPSASERGAGFVSADDFEFVELVNTGTTTYGLSGLRFTMGIQFEFARSTLTHVGPGEFVLLVRNRSAFEARYGAGRRIAGQYSGRLDNSGERVLLVNGAGETVLDFRYGTSGDWPTSADGGGHALEAVDPAGRLDEAAHWRASPLTGGSPGEPNQPPALKLEATMIAPGFLRFRFDGRPGLGYRLMVTDHLGVDVWRVLQQGGIQPRSEVVDLVVNVGAAPEGQYFRVSIP